MGSSCPISTPFSIQTQVFHLHSQAHVGIYPASALGRHFLAFVVIVLGRRKHSSRERPWVWWELCWGTQGFHCRIFCQDLESSEETETTAEQSAEISGHWGCRRPSAGEVARAKALKSVREMLEGRQSGRRVGSRLGDPVGIAELFEEQENVECLRASCAKKWLTAHLLCWSLLFNCQLPESLLSILPYLVSSHASPGYCKVPFWSGRPVVCKGKSSPGLGRRW